MVTVYNTSSYDVVILHGQADRCVRQAQANIELDRLRCPSGDPKTLARIHGSTPSRHDFGPYPWWSYCAYCGCLVWNRGCKGCEQRFCHECFVQHVNLQKLKYMAHVPDGTLVFVRGQRGSNLMQVTTALCEGEELAEWVPKCCLDESVALASVERCGFKSKLRLDGTGEQPEVFVSTSEGITRCALHPDTEVLKSVVSRVLYVDRVSSVPVSEKYEESKHQCKVRHLVDLDKAQKFQDIRANHGTHSVCEPLSFEDPDAWASWSGAYTSNSQDDSDRTSIREATAHAVCATAKPGQIGVGGLAGTYGYTLETFHKVEFSADAIRKGSSLRILIGSNVKQSAQDQAYATEASTRPAIQKWQTKYPQHAGSSDRLGYEASASEGASSDMVEVDSIRSNAGAKQLTKGIVQSKAKGLARGPVGAEQAARLNEVRYTLTGIGVAVAVGGASGALLGAAKCGSNEYQRQKVEARRLIDVLFFAEAQNVSQISEVIIEFLGSDWKQILWVATRGACVGASIGAVVRGAGAGFALGIGRAAAQLELRGCVQASRCVRGVGDSLGFIVTSVVFATEMGAALYHWSGGSMHHCTLGRCAAGATIRAAANAAVISLAFIPFAGITLCITGGLLVNLTDVLLNWSDQLAEWCVPFSDEEGNFYKSQARERLISLAAEVLQIDRASYVPKCETEDERSAAKQRLKRVLRRWMLEIHPDKNHGRRHAYFHIILAAFTILDQALGQQYITIPEMLALVDGASH